MVGNIDVKREKLNVNHINGCGGMLCHVNWKDNCNATQQITKYRDSNDFGAWNIMSALLIVENNKGQKQKQLSLLGIKKKTKSCLIVWGKMCVCQLLCNLTQKIKHTKTCGCVCLHVICMWQLFAFILWRVCDVVPSLKFISSHSGN